MGIKLSRESVEAAKTLLSHPLIIEIFKELESEAIEAALETDPLEHDLRAALLVEVRAIRSLHSKLLTLKAREASLNDKGA